MQVPNSQIPGALIELFHYRWAALVLAELHTSAGAKFVTLHRRLGISRDSLRRTLEALIQRGLAAHNPDYGHPMRPEYILLPAGVTIAPSCARLLVVIRSLGVEETALRKWSLPTIAAIAFGHDRFASIRAALPGVTPRALAGALKDLEAAELAGRDIVCTYPPQALYRLRQRGRQIAALLEDLITALNEQPDPPG